MLTRRRERLIDWWFCPENPYQLAEVHAHATNPPEPDLIGACSFLSNDWR